MDRLTTRRSFLKVTGLGIASLALAPITSVKLILKEENLKCISYGPAGTKKALAYHNKVLKEFYLPAIQEQLNTPSLLGKLAKQKTNGGKKIKVEMNYGKTDN